MYAIAITALIVLLKKYKANMTFLILIFCVFLQFYDLSKWFTSKYTSFSVEKEYSSLLADKSWEEIAKDYGHVYISGTIASDYTALYSIAKWANENDLTLNRFYFARSISGISETWSDKLENPNDTDLFIFKKKDFADYVDMDYLYQLDGLIVGSSVEIEGLDYYDPYPWVLEVESFSGNDNTESDDEGMLICHTGGTIYGPYVTVPAGTYRITYSGDNLQVCSFDCVCSSGSVSIDYEVISIESDQIVYEISLEEKTEKVEFRLFNDSEEDAVLYQVAIE